MIPDWVMGVLGASRALRYWIAGRIPGTPQYWWDIKKPATCAHQGAWMRCRKDEGFEVCSPFTRECEDGTVPETCKKFHLCAWKWGNDEDRPEGFRARAYAYHVTIHPEDIDSLRRAIWSRGTGVDAALSAASLLRR